MFQRKYFAAWFFFVRCCLFYTSESLNIDSDFETQLQRPLSEEINTTLIINQEFFEEVCKECSYCQLYAKFIKLINHQKTVDEIVNSRYEKAVVLLADDMKDGITLAQFLSQNNRVLPKKIQKDLDHSEISLYDLILENYHLYKNVNTSTVFFVYPRKTSDAIFAKYIAKRVMDNLKKVKVVLTLSEPSSNLDVENFNREKELGVSRIFKVFRYVERYKNTTSFVVMTEKFTENNTDDDYLNKDGQEELDYVKLIDSYVKSSNTSDSEKLLGIYVNDGTVKVIFSGGFTKKNYKKVITHINNFMSYADERNFNHRFLSNSNFSIRDDEFDKCIFNFTFKKDNRIKSTEEENT